AALSLAYAFTGQTTDALSLAEKNLEPPVGVMTEANESLRVVFLAEAYALVRHGTVASSLGTKALKTAEGFGERGHAAWALRLLGDIELLSELAAADNAENMYQRSLSLANELNMRPLVAHCRLGLGKLHRRRRDREQAQEHLTAAMA